MRKVERAKAYYKRKRFVYQQCLAPFVLLFSVHLGRLTKRVIAIDPLALHQVHEVSPGKEIVISLNGYDLDGDATAATITTLPNSGKLYQVSYVYNIHGYNPKQGVQINSVPISVLGKNNKVVYVRPHPDREWPGEWDRFEYIVQDAKARSQPGTIVLTGPSKVVVASDFNISPEGWTVVGNYVNERVIHEATSRGMNLNHYVYALDDLVNVNSEGIDLDRWYFLAPKKFLGWHAIVYGGVMEFTLASFSGDFSDSATKSCRKRPTNIVEIHCKKCNYYKGITIGYPLLAVGGFDGNVKLFRIDFTEISGWMKDPKNTLMKWTTPTKCEFIEVLSAISSLKILGDFTNRHESVSMDDVKFRIRGEKSQIPPCAQRTPDASKCIC